MSPFGTAQKTHFCCRPGQRSANLSGLRVSENGSIFVPYVGKIRVSERTPDSARQLLQRQLEAVAPGAQVQLLDV